MSIINKIKDLLSSSDQQSPEREDTTDSFADGLILEFRRAVNEAVINELEKCQEKYLSNILRNSYFPIEAISLIPSDHETALITEEFFRVHSELDTDFEKSFFSDNLPKEYRTHKGAKALLKHQVLFTIQPSKLGIDNPTEDESYQITIRGNRKKFTAVIELGRITTDTPPVNSNLQKPTISHSEPVLNFDNKNPELSETVSAKNSSARTKIYITIKDKNGERQLDANLPVVLGRASHLDNDPHYEKINIDSTYISRNQFVIFDVYGTVYGFIPKEAKLTAISGRRGTIRPLSLVEIETNGFHMTFGQPLDTAMTVVNPENASLYPSITIKLDGNTSQETMTPVPNVKR